GGGGTVRHPLGAHYPDDTDGVILNRRPSSACWECRSARPGTQGFATLTGVQAGIGFAVRLAERVRQRATTVTACCIVDVRRYPLPTHGDWSRQRSPSFLARATSLWFYALYV